MQSNPLISIIIPIYNTERYIHRCIDSILAQRYSNFELILVDDGSTDGVGVVCDDYAQNDDRIRVFHKDNGGVSSARNLGIDNAHGDWIAFVDSDDFVKENWLFDYVREIDKNPRVGLVYQGIIRLIDGVESIKDSVEDRVFVEDEFVAAYIYLDRTANNFGHTCSKIYRADVFNQSNLRFNQRLSFCEDLEFTFRFMQKIDRIATINSYNYVYAFDRDVSLGRINHSYEVLDRLANIVNKQLSILDARTEEVCEELFDSVYNFRFRALKSLYKPSVNSTAVERRNIIKKYYTTYYGDLNRIDLSIGNEELIVKVLALRNARIIDWIYRTVFTLKSKLDKISSKKDK